MGEDYPWLKQIRDGVEVYVHRCMIQFAGGAPQNGMAISSGADYVMPARTAEEIKQTIAAEQGSVTAARKGFKLTDDSERIAKREGLADPAAVFDEHQPKAAPEPAKTPSPPAKPKGWIL